jgi:hypothetical protein
MSSSKQLRQRSFNTDASFGDSTVTAVDDSCKKEDSSAESVVEPLESKPILTEELTCKYNLIYAHALFSQNLARIRNILHMLNLINDFCFLLIY